MSTCSTQDGVLMIQTKKTRKFKINIMQYSKIFDTDALNIFFNKNHQRNRKKNILRPQNTYTKKINIFKVKRT
jgi:hypothetical protein